ncbi:alpha/beta fold hydrolase [Streptomyces sp. NRRL WC-3744]|uniref:alpha/beta fold hydrolase n=1 Tax=Streptomyces sp. NRRL WC-3744 TaxID=1463935 RepID=UPI003B6371F3
MTPRLPPFDDDDTLVVMSAFAEHSETLSFTTCDGSLAYRDAGEGRPLVLLHAGFFDHSMWDEQIRAFAPHYRVIAPDARGHGASSNATRPFRPADDLAALLRHLDVGPAVLVGISMGGGTAVDTALEHPELVRAVVVSGVGDQRAVLRESLEPGGPRGAERRAGSRRHRGLAERARAFRGRPAPLAR